MPEKNYMMVRVSKEAHDTLRWISYKQNKRIIEIVDELLEGKGPTISEKVTSMLKEKL